MDVKIPEWLRLNKVERRVAELETRVKVRDSLVKRIEKLEAELAPKDLALQQVTDFIQFSFDKARWEIVPPTGGFRPDELRERLGYLHACVTIWEKMGKEVPSDIGKMVLALAGRLETEKAAK